MNIQLSPQEVHDVKSFIKFFSEIPEEKWCIGQVTDTQDGKVKHCAAGHLMWHNFSYTSSGHKPIFPQTKEVAFLESLFQKIPPKIIDGLVKFYGIAFINDRAEEFGNTPRERILNALKHLLKE